MITNKLATRAPVAALISLDDPACEDPALAGNKAATLAVLRRAGFEVPPGVVVSLDVLVGVDSELPEDLQAALQDMPHLLGPGPWAVRSSSTAEDTEQASFAGQFETILNVDSSGLADAVRHVWRSARTDRVIAYAGDQAPDSMAVLIQPMIAADAAGVAFTVDPVSGRHRTVIEAVEGLGERLVSGSATPERWTLEENGSIQAPAVATALDAEQAQAIGDLARRVEEHFGRPQDIEWAIADRAPWLLQARPITTLRSAGPELIPIPIEVPPGDWEKDTIHQPAPFSPFVMVLWAAYRKMIAAAGASSASSSIDSSTPRSAVGCIPRSSPSGRPLPDVGHVSARALLPAGCWRCSCGCTRPSAGALVRPGRRSLRTSPTRSSDSGSTSGGPCTRRTASGPWPSILVRSQTKTWPPSSTTGWRW